jgi:protoporphyrinogen oxidase
MSRRDQVVIVGAGLAGLVTALELSEQGVDCVVLEAAARPGGRVGTFTFPDGALAEAHLEEIWEGSPAFPLLARLGLRWREHETASSVLVDGVLHPYRRGDGAGYPSGCSVPSARPSSPSTSGCRRCTATSTRRSGSSSARPSSRRTTSRRS